MNTESPHSSAQLTKNRLAFLALVAAFLLPLILAYVVHFTGSWQQRGLASHGVLLQDPLDLENIPLYLMNGERFEDADARKLWWMVFILPNDCSDACVNSLYQMRQVQTATGAERQRVRVLLVQTSAAEPETEALLGAEFSDFKRVSADAMQLNERLSPAQLSDRLISNSQQVFLMDPMGALFMTYPSYSDEQESIQKGKLILQDLKRVLRLSRIG